MDSILDISDTLLENLVAELNHPEHAPLPNIEFDNVEENVCGDILDVLDSLASPVSPLNVASHHVCQNLSVLNWDTENISCSADGNITDDAERPAQVELTSQGQNLSHLGYINLDSDTWSYNRNVGVDIVQAEQAAPCEITSKIYQNLDGLRCINIDCDDGGGFMRAEQLASGELISQQVSPSLSDFDTASYNVSWNDGESMQAEQAAQHEITSEACQNLDGLGYVNYDSGWSSSDVSWHGTTKLNSLCDPMLTQKKCNSALRDQIPPVLTSHVRLGRKRKNSAHESNASVTCAHTLKVQHCESDVDVAIENHQMEEVLSHEKIAAPVNSTEQSEDASQLDKCQVQLIGKSSEIPLKNSSKGRRNESTSYSCTECGKQFSSKYYMDIHSRVHTGEKPYKCAQCDYVCNRTCDLSRHKRTHSDARPFICLICNRAFKLKGYLTEHQRTHSDMRLLKCSTCNATFRHKRGLTDHQRTHSDETFTCDICKKSFRRKESLLFFKNIHTGTRPYEYSVCNVCSIPIRRKLHKKGDSS